MWNMAHVTQSSYGSRSDSDLRSPYTHLPHIFQFATFCMSLSNACSSIMYGEGAELMHLEELGLTRNGGSGKIEQWQGNLSHGRKTTPGRSH